MKKRIAWILLAAVAVLLMMPSAGFAEEVTSTEETTWRDFDFSLEQEGSSASAQAPTSGSCGDGLTWILADGTLTVSGSGEMADFAPWEESREQIKRVIFTGGVTVVGESSFENCVNLEYVDFGDSMREIRSHGFFGCTGLKGIHLPVTFRRFGRECFRDCDQLEMVYCDGGMPSFNSACFWSATAVSIYHSPMYEWPTSSVEQLETNFGGRLKVRAASVDVFADYEPEEPIVAAISTPMIEEPPATQPVAIVTEPPATQPVVTVTEPPVTRPVVMDLEPIVITAPATEPATVPMQPSPEGGNGLNLEWNIPEPEHTISIPDGQQEQPQRVAGGDGWIGLAIVVGVLTLIIFGALCFKLGSHRKGRYE